MQAFEQLPKSCKQRAVLNRRREKYKAQVQTQPGKKSKPIQYLDTVRTVKFGQDIQLIVDILNPSL